MNIDTWTDIRRSNWRNRVRLDGRSSAAKCVQLSVYANSTMLCTHEISAQHLSINDLCMYRYPNSGEILPPISLCTFKYTNYSYMYLYLCRANIHNICSVHHLSIHSSCEMATCYNTTAIVISIIIICEWKTFRTKSY